ncbi:MAG: HEAT repeat domain-containing protein [Candidatus Brocadiia bacterium]
MSERAGELVGQLRDFRTRKTAMDELLMLGEEALPALIEALAHPLENVRWSARTVLVRLGGDPVVERLIETLDDSRRQAEAVQALRQITGEPMGPDRQEWARWAGRGERPEAEEAEATPPEAPAPEAPAEPAAPPPEPLSDAELVRQAVEGTQVGIEERSGGFLLDVPLEGERHQQVTVSFGSSDFEGEPLVVVYTECGPGDAKNFEWALRQNLRMSFGAIGLRDRQDSPTFVMVNTHPRATASPTDLRKSILLLARRGDALEKALTKGDQR